MSQNSKVKINFQPCQIYLYSLRPFLFLTATPQSLSSPATTTGSHFLASTDYFSSKPPANFPTTSLTNFLEIKFIFRKFSWKVKKLSIIDIHFFQKQYKHTRNKKKLFILRDKEITKQIY